MLNAHHRSGRAAPGTWPIECQLGRSLSQGLNLLARLNRASTSQLAMRKKLKMEYHVFAVRAMARQRHGWATLQRLRSAYYKAHKRSHAHEVPSRDAIKRDKLGRGTAGCATCGGSTRNVSMHGGLWLPMKRTSEEDPSRNWVTNEERSWAALRPWLASRLFREASPHKRATSALVFWQTTESSFSCASLLAHQMLTHLTN